MLHRVFIFGRIFHSLSSSSSSYICHGVGSLVDPFRSHVSRSLFKGLPCPIWQPGKQNRNEPGDVDWGGYGRSADPHTITKMYGVTYSEDTSRQEEHKQKRTLP